MPRRTNDFQTIRSEGGLLPPDLLRRVIEPASGLDGIKPGDYGLPESERLNEVITQSWNRLRKHWVEFRSSSAQIPHGEPGTGLTNDRWSLPLLRELGFGLLPTSSGPELNGRSYPISRFFGPVPIHLVGFGVNLDKRAAGVVGAAKGNPHGLVQEFLNNSAAHLWALVSNGLRIRVLRDNQALSRQSFLEFDLEAMFEGEVYSDFVLLWLMLHATRFNPREADKPDSCWLETWAKYSEEQGTRALGDLRGGVERALQILGEGFTSHPQNSVLREALRSGELKPIDLHSQLLRLVYRLIFLFVSEDRTLEGKPLLHPPDETAEGRIARNRYSAYYGTARLREMASKIKGSRHGDLWRQFQMVVRALSGDENAESIREHLALPTLGSFLWDPNSTMALNDAELSNYDLLEAIRDLAFTRQNRVLRPVDYKNLGAEELGGVYETLLALTPQISGDGARFTFAEFAGNERRTSGAYYTPDSLVQCLLDSALDPVVEQAIKGKTGEEAEKAILALKVCDPAVGSGHFLVGAAHRLARHLARVRALTQDESEPSPPMYQHALRDVIGRCLYGVDINPMSAELCRVSLWLEALEPGKPLSFLDHHIRVGNSLLGTTPKLIKGGIPDAAYRPIEGDDKAACALLKKINIAERRGAGPLFGREDDAAQSTFEQAAASLEELPDDRPEAIQAKELAFRNREQTEEYRLKKLLADTWCAAFVTNKSFLEPGRETSVDGITHGDLIELARNKYIPADLCTKVEKLSDKYRFFHWHLAFPEVFSKDGFDCVLGNPPWEKIQAEEQNFFAASAPNISKSVGATRKRLILELQDTNPELSQSWLLHRRTIEATNIFLKTSGLFPLSGQGKMNTYAVFAELAMIITNSGGRFGQILPLGIVTDDNTKDFSWHLIFHKMLVCLFGFENESFIFPNVHHSFKFCLLTGRTRTDIVDPPDFAFFCRSVDDLSELNRYCQMTADDIQLMNPNTKNCPTFRSRLDFELVRAIYRRVPVISLDDSSSPWNVKPHRIINPTDDSKLMVKFPPSDPSDELQVEEDEIFVRVYEGKMIHQFDHRFGGYLGQTDAQRNQGKLPEFTSEEHNNPTFLSQPQFWIARQVIDPWLSEHTSRNWLCAFRDITSSVVFRTCISAIIPRVGPVDPCRCIFFDELQSGSEICSFFAALNSFAFDFVARQSVSSTHLAIFILKQLPIPSPFSLEFPKWGEAATSDWISKRVLELTYTAWDLEPFAQDCDFDGSPFQWNDERRFLLRSELDAAFFHLYLPSSPEGDWKRAVISEGAAVDESENDLIKLKESFPTPREAVAYIMDTFPIVKRRDITRTEVTDQDGLLVKKGTFITKDTILEIYDKMQEAIRTGVAYQTRLNPPPADPSLCHPPKETN